MEKAAPGNGVYTKKVAAVTSNTVTALTLPHVIDNSKLKYFPPIGNQGSLGSCAAFATTYYVMTYTTAMARDWDVKAGGSSMIFSPKWSYNLANGGSNNGSAPSTIAYLMSYYGASTLDLFPYDSNYREWPGTAQQWRSALKYKIDGYGGIGSLNTSTGLANLKSALNNGMVVCMITENIFGWKGNLIKNNPNSHLDDSEVGKHATYYMESGSSGHAMTIVGYNDDIWIDRNNNNKLESGELGGFRVANSWGSGWGDSGFTWFSYAAIKDTIATTGYDGILSGNSVMYLTTDGADYIPQVTAEITLTTAHRKDLEYLYGINWGEAALPDTTGMLDWSKGWYYMSASSVGFPLGRSGGDYSIAGTTDPSTGTIMFDLSAGIKGQNKNQTDWTLAGGPLSFSVGVKDVKGASTPVTINNIVFENWNTGERIAAADLGEPETTDEDLCWYHSISILNPGLTAPLPDPAVSSLPQFPEGVAVDADCVSKTDVREWRFTPSETGVYIFKTNSQNIYTEIRNDAKKLLYSGSKTNGDITYIRAALFSGETYVLRASIANTYLNSYISFTARINKIDPVSDAGLADILCKSQYYGVMSMSPEFNRDTFSYTVVMLADQSNIMIFPVPESERSYPAGPVTAPFTGDAIALGESKDYTIQIVSRDGTNTSEYHVTAIKPAAFTVTLDPQGGTAIGPVTVANCSYLSQSPSTQRPGYIFSGWYPTPACDTAAIRFPYKVVGDITLYAKWVFSGISGYYRYRLNGNNAEIIKYSGYESVVAIPAALDGYTVTAIADDAFKSKSSIIDLKMPEGITSIGARAFSSCAKLKNVYIPAGVTSIGDQAFYYCPALESVTIPDGVASIGQLAFADCRSLSRIYFKGNAPSMGLGGESGNQVFGGCMPCFTVYYLFDKTGFTALWYGWPAAVYDPGISHTVTFNVNGSTGTPPPPQNVFSGVKLLEPRSPRYSGYTFGGWYIDPLCTGAFWDFGTDPVGSDLVLYAKWIPNSSVVLSTPYLTAKAPNYKEVKLTWKPVTNAKGYKIYKRINGVYRNIATVDGDLTYTDHDVKAGVYHYYKIRAYNVPYKDDYYSRYSYYRYARPAWPRIYLKAVSDSYNSVKLTWNTIGGATYYKLYRGTAYNNINTCINERVTGSGTITYIDRDGLTTGKRYYYRVQPFDDGVTPEAYGSRCSYKYAVPSWPRIYLTAASNTYNSVKLTWNAIDGATYYKVYRGTSYRNINTCINERAEGAGTITYIDSDGLNTGTRYYYSIKAFDDSAAPEASSPYCRYRYTTPAWPRLYLKAVSSGYDRIVLSWNNINGAKRYDIYRSMSYSRGYEKIGGTADLNYTDSAGLTAGKTYYYKVQPIDPDGGDQGTGPFSGYKYARPVPSAPVITLLRTSATSISISWDAVEGATGYMVYRATSLGGTYVLVKTVTDGASYENTGLYSGKNYYYRVRAYCKPGTVNVYGPYSEKKCPQ